MADQQNNIVIQVADGVAPTIAPKIVAVADASILAADSLDRLQIAVNGINGSALDSFAASVRSIPTSTSNAANALDRLENRVITSAASFDALAVSVANLDKQVIALGLSLLQVTPLLANGANAGRSFSSASNGLTQGVRNAGNAMSGAGIGARGYSNLLATAEGRTGGLNRAAGRLLSTLLGTGPVIQAAFVAFGAIALVGVLDQMGEAVGRVRDAYKQMQVAAIDADTAAILSGEKLLKIKQASLFSAVGVANLFNDSPTQKTIEIENAQAALKQIEAARQVQAAQDRVNESGLTGEKLAKQRTLDAQNNLRTLQQEKTQVDALTQSYVKQKDAVTTVTVDKVVGMDELGNTTSFQQTRQVAKITDPAQQKALGDQIRATVEASAALDTQIKVATLDIEAMGRREPLAELKDDAKAATAEIKRINDAFDKLKNGLDFVDSSKALSFFKDQQQQDSTGRFANNKQVQDFLDSRVGASQQGVDRQNETVSNLVQGLSNQASAIGTYSDAQKIALELDKQSLQLQKEHIAISPQLLSVLRDLDTEIVQAAQFQSALNAAYNAANDPLDKFTAMQQALSQLIQDDPEHLKQYTAQLAVATQNYNDAINPLNAINRGLGDARAGITKYGDELTAFDQVQAISNQLRTSGNKLTDDATKKATDYFVALEHAKQVQSDVNAIYAQNQGALTKIVDEYNALEIAEQKGIITRNQEKTQLLQLELQYARLKASMGDTSWATTQGAALSKFLADYKGMVAGVDSLYAGLIDTIGNGLANAIGRALAYGEDLGAALKDVARQALSELISGFIKLGLQWILQATIGDTLSKLATAQSIAQAAAVAAAWATPAAFVSIATLGEADAIGAAGLALTVALSAGLAATSSALSSAAGLAAAGHSAGGIVTGPGNGTSDSILARLSNGEGVVKASAMADVRNRNAVLAMNAGQRATITSANASSASSVGTQTQMRFVVEDHTSGAKIVFGGVTHDEVRFIARDIAGQEINAKAPGVIAADIANPNGKTSKSLKRNTQGGSRRRIN